MTEPQQSQVVPHLGNALMYVAETYPTLYAVIMEVIQNAIDEDAKRISVHLDRRRRRVVVTDDGNGASIEKFNEALTSVCQTMKTRDKLGQFGIGLIAPLGKCVSFKFTSCPKGGENGFCEWEFVTAEVQKQHEAVTIPRREIPSLEFGKAAKTIKRKGGSQKRVVSWRTMVTINQFAKDRTISRITNIDTLIDGVVERFGVAMRRKEVVLSVKFVAEDGSEVSREVKLDTLYTGIPLQNVRYTDKTGATEFRLFLSQQTTKGYEGKVVLGEANNDFRFALQYFLGGARTREYCVSDALDALRSGIFEGEILSTGATLNPNRTSFKVDDAFVEFCLAINRWYEEHGKAYTEAVREAEAEVRYQELGLTSLRAIEELLKSPRFKHLAECLEEFQQGRTHDPEGVDLSKIAGVQDEPSHDTVKEKVKRTRRTSRQPGRTHTFSVTGPRGQYQTLLKHEGLGLQFSHVVMAESNRLWELDKKRGILHFNIRHPLWVESDDNDRRILQLQEIVALQALQILGAPSNLEDALRNEAEEFIKYYMFLAKTSAAFNPRKKLRTPTDSG